ncbi:MAG: hypothetical protein V4563_14255 [Pseudomonadota bacterium]
MNSPTTFEAWMQQVNSYIDSLCGMTTDDLPDVCYRDWFEDGLKPASAAKRAIRNAGDF